MSENDLDFDLAWVGWMSRPPIRGEEDRVAEARYFYEAGRKEGEEKETSVGADLERANEAPKVPVPGDLDVAPEDSG